MFAHFHASLLPTKVRLEVENIIIYFSGNEMISFCMGYADVCQAETGESDQHSKVMR